MTKPDTADHVAARINEIMPPHAHMPSEWMWTWTTPGGLWRIELDLVYEALDFRWVMKVLGGQADLTLPVDEPSLELVLGLLRQWGAIGDGGAL